MMIHNNTQRQFVVAAFLIVIFCIPAYGSEMPLLTDYTFMWWAYGWRGKSPQGEKVLAIQTGRYGVAVDVGKVSILHFGSIDNSVSYPEALTSDNSAVFKLPLPEFTLSVTVEGNVYTCKRGPIIKENLPKEDYGGEFPVRIIESGRYLQRFDITSLEFTESSGGRLDAACRLEIIAWPDRLALILEIIPENDLGNAELLIELAGKTEKLNQTLKKGTASRVALVWSPVQEHIHPDPGARVMVTNRNSENAPVPVTYDRARGWHHIDMPVGKWDGYSGSDHLDRLSITLENPTGRLQVFRLLFAFDKSFPGITGMTPMIRDAAGNPTGIPVQISKNWHSTKDRTFLYQGPWFHGFTMIRVPPRSEWSGEFNVAYAYWGGVPAASHAQLCLVGWGTNQLWDQAAIGSWGESICYDPDVNLGRSMIDDIRPLMVWSMSEEPRKKWGWTNNVGGGDFLVYFDGNREKHFLSRMRTAYLSYGPNLTEVVYAGITADGAITARITVSSPRCDDINRAYHHIRYDVLKPVTFTRLAFYQLGSDGYNDQQFKLIARGNKSGMREEWQPERGGKRYHRRGIPCEGNVPWFSLHQAVPGAQSTGAWANRGLVIRNWKARLGGKDIPAPFASVYGTEDKMPGANIEINPPPELKRLEPGDYIEADIEMLILPMSADDYYGPNEALRASLLKDADTWKPVHRQAVGNDLVVKAISGTLVRKYPITVKVNVDGHAEIEVTGGLGYVPLTFTGLDRHDGFILRRINSGKASKVDQSVHGSDYWQTVYDPVTESWSVTYNVSLDSLMDKPQNVRFILE